MNIVAFNPFKHLEYARAVTDVAISDKTRGLVALDKKTGEPQGLVLLDNWLGNSVMSHVALQNPMAARYLEPEVMKYVFDTCGKAMMLGTVTSDNEKALKFDKHLGYKELFRIPSAHAEGVDLVVLQMLREDCRYFKKLSEVA